MASFSLDVGDIFLLDTGAEKNHWYVAIAPFSDEEFVLVNISTWYQDSEFNDGACILQPGGRMPRFIQRKSFIAYLYARSYTAAQITKLIAPSSPIPYDKLDPQILRRIQKESLKSKNLKKKYIQAIQKYLESH